MNGVECPDRFSGECAAGPVHHVAINGEHDPVVGSRGNERPSSGRFGFTQLASGCCAMDHAVAFWLLTKYGQAWRAVIVLASEQNW